GSLRLLVVSVGRFGGAVGAAQEGAAGVADGVGHAPTSPPYRCPHGSAAPWPQSSGRPSRQQCPPWPWWLAVKHGQAFSLLITRPPWPRWWRAAQAHAPQRQPVPAPLGWASARPLRGRGSLRPLARSRPRRSGSAGRRGWFRAVGPRRPGHRVPSSGVLLAALVLGAGVGGGQVVGVLGLRALPHGFPARPLPFGPPLVLGALRSGVGLLLPSPGFLVGLAHGSHAERCIDGLADPPELADHVVAVELAGAHVGRSLE